MDKLKLSTANIVILVAGVVMLIASFLAFNKISLPSFKEGGVTFRRWLALLQRVEQPLLPDRDESPRSSAS